MRFLSNLINTSTYKGLSHGYSIPMLPAKINSFYNHILIRIIRVIGGVCFLLYISKFDINFPFYLKILIDGGAFFQVFSIFIICTIKAMYCIYTLLYKRQLFEVRNSSINNYATYLAKVVYCTKFSCVMGGGAATLLGSGIALDSLLEQSNRPKIFQPLFKESLDNFHERTGLFPPYPQIAKEETSDSSLITNIRVEKYIQDYHKLDPEQKKEF